MNNTEPSEQQRNHWHQLAEHIGAEVPEDLNDYFGGAVKIDADVAALQQLPTTAEVASPSGEATPGKESASAPVTPASSSTPPREPKRGGDSSRRGQRPARTAPASQDKPEEKRKPKRAATNWDLLAGELGLDVPEPAPEALQSAETVEDAISPPTETSSGIEALENVHPDLFVPSEADEFQLEPPQTDVDEDSADELDSDYIEFEVEDLSTAGQRRTDAKLSTPKPPTPASPNPPRSEAHRKPRDQQRSRERKPAPQRSGDKSAQHSHGRSDTAPAPPPPKSATAQKPQGTQQSSKPPAPQGSSTSTGSSKKKSPKLPTWQEAVGFVVDSNITQRKRFPNSRRKRGRH